MKILTKQKQMNALRFNFKKAFKHYYKNHFFIVYTLLNFFIPFLLCLIGACVKDYGTLIVIVIGLTSSFFTIFNQLAILMSIAVSIQRIEATGTKNNITFDIGSQLRANALASSLTAATIYGCIMMLLFILSCGLYTSFSATYQNLNNISSGAINLAWKFIGISCPTILMSFVSNIFLIEIFITSGSFKATVYYVGIISIELLLATVLSLNTNLNIIGIGLGLLIGNVLGLILYSIDCFTHTNLIKLKTKVQNQELNNTLKNTFKFSSRYIFGTILKAFLVLGIGLGLSLSSKDVFGTMLLARIIWYNIMYTSGCFGDAIILQANFTKAKYHNNLDHAIDIVNFQKFQITLVSIVEFIMLLTSCLLVPVISDIYLQNTGVISNAFINVNGNGWIINSWLNIPYNDIGFNPNFGTTNIQPNGYVPGGSTAMIYLSIFIWTIALTKIMCFSPFYTKKEKKSNVIMAYLTPFLIICFVAAMGLGSMSLQGKVGNFFFGFQGFSFALMIVGVLLFLIGILSAIKSNKFMKSDRFLNMYNQYVQNTESI